MRKIFDKLFSTSAAGLYIILFAIAIAVATFIENDYGTSAAQKVVFQAKWFELLLVLFGIAIIVNVFRFKMIQQKKWAVLTFHLSIILILIGAGVTRYAGYEGMMHIRENDRSNTILSSETYLQFHVAQQGRKYRFDERVLFASLGNNHFHKKYQVGTSVIDIEVIDFIPNPYEQLIDHEDGVPTLKVVVASTTGGRDEYFVPQGATRNVAGTLFNFGTNEIPQAVNLSYDGDQIYFKAPFTQTRMEMTTEALDTLAAGEKHPLVLRSLYSNGELSYVVGEFNKRGRVVIESGARKMTSNNFGAVKMKVGIDGTEDVFYITGSKGVEGRPKVINIGNTEIACAYGAKNIVLPFSIKLHDFIMERYPGTDNASSYASEVSLIDDRIGLNEAHRIYMNHILDYGGYRFFQSSFDKDELGTYLSVNHDFWGTWISYIGYILLTLGMIFTLFTKSSRFRKLSENIQKMRKEATLIPLLFLLGLGSISAQEVIEPELTVIDAAHAQKFGEGVVQDHQGRFKPINTMSREILRKVSRKEIIHGLNSDQVFLGMMFYPREWSKVEMIKMGRHKTMKSMLGKEGPLVAYSDLFDEEGRYKLSEEVRRAYSLKPIDRGVLEKELLKLDERLNIMSMVFNGHFLNIFPVPNDPNNHWNSPVEAAQNMSKDSLNTFIQDFMPAYMLSLQNSVKSGDYSQADELIAGLGILQRKYSGDIMPSEQKINAELTLNNLNVFGKLSRYFGLLSIFFLVMLFTQVFSPGKNLTWMYRIGLGLLILFFAFQTLGLGLRWYVSGRAPWSNGYESMIYISWTTILAGILFARKSYGALAATTILASTILMVAGLSWLDPEITPLVPVLKSYWLTIHVSLEAGSYGFLILGAIIGILNLILMIIANKKNEDRIYRIIKEMTHISEMTLIGGLFMVSIGTYLGGVWANESWGRYWGWDAKETWALVTILVYAFILHMRFIPGLRGLYAFNVSSLFGFATVMMTYFGVNYYLSGLHSYAAGDPVPVPSFVYYIVISLLILSWIAFWRYTVVRGKKG